MTILNLLLMYLGPLHEHTLIVILLAIQVSKLIQMSVIQKFSSFFQIQRCS